jgi:hypothetical protein
MAMPAAVGMLRAASGLAADGQSTMCKVRIENISSGNVQKLSSGGDAPFALSPGVWLVHSGSVPVFKSWQKDWRKGLEAQAEDGNPDRLGASLTAREWRRDSRRGQSWSITAKS